MKLFILVKLIDQSILLENLVKLSEKSKARTREGKDEKINTFEGVNTLYEAQELILTAFRSGIIPIKETQLETLTAK